MPSSSNTVWNNEPYTRNQYVCAPHTTTYANTVYTTEDKSWNDVDRRVKPDDLILNMTSQPKQSTAKSRMGQVTWIDGRAKDPYCPLYPTTYFYVRKWGYNNPGYQYSIDGSYSYDSDWATELRRKIKDTTINLGTTLAEYRQSARMFGNAAQGLVDAWRAFRKLKPRKGLTPCSVPAAYLQYTYGVQPLVSDLYDSVEALWLRLGHPVRRRYFTQAKYAAKKQVDSNWGSGPLKINASIKQSQRVTAYVEFDLEKASLFRIGNPLELAWEVIPYSFVIDWMIPIGDYLASIDALRAVNTMRVARVEKVAYDHNAVLKRTGYGGVEYDSYLWGRTALRSYRSHERIVSHTIPQPSLPTWNPSASFHKVVNGLTLLWQVMGQNRGLCKIRKPRYLKGIGFHQYVG